MPRLLHAFRARSSFRSLLQELRRWLNYRPERSYMRGR